MPAKEERVHQVSGEQGGGVGEPKQGAHRRIENVERTVLSAENGMRVSILRSFF